uniref:DNA-directed DNA polymerase n=1 Tax=Globodera pallida TaxID=36090 RepID=A0A183CP96_GLOPA
MLSAAKRQRPPKTPFARAQDKQKGHLCGRKFCRICLGFHAPRECYIPYRPKVKKDKRLIFFDFECTTGFKPDPALAQFKHQVNFCYAHVTCTRCIEKDVWDKELEKACAICGPLRFYSWAPFYYDDTDVDRAFRVDDPLAAFTKWLLHFEAKTLGLEPNDCRKRKRVSAKNNILDEEAADTESDDDDDNNFMIFGEKGEKPVSVTTYAYAHAGSRYDHVLVYGEMLRMGVRPNLVRQGNHLLEMRAPKKGGITATVFRDSYKLIPVKLAAFVKTFGLEINGVEDKKYFPHKFNKEENYDNALDSLPPLEMYYPGGHFPEERKKLERWHRENFNTRFLLREVIADYCKTDVQILAHGVIKMRKLFFNETFDDITDSVTIPSAYAHVTCTRCIEKDVWDKELEKACAICGPLRFYSWAPFYYDDTDVDRAFRVDDPLAAFTKWLLHFEAKTLGLEPNDCRKRKRVSAKNNILDEEAADTESDDDDDNNFMIFGEKGEKPVSVTTYAYAHAGSRYDHVLVYGEMLRMGVRPNLVRQGNHLLEMRAPKKGGITATVFRDR